MATTTTNNSVTYLSDTSRYKDTAIVLRLPSDIREFGLWNSDPSFRDATNYSMHVVRSVDIGRLDLLAHRYYGSPDFWWMIADTNNLIDMFNDMYVGQVLRIPDRSIIEAYLNRRVAR